MNAWVPGRNAVLEWTVKESLVEYMQRDESFTVTATGGASFDPERGVSVQGVIGDDGVLRLTGEITLSAHSGSLAIALVAAELDPVAGLSIADPVDGLPERMTLVTVKPLEDATAGEAGAGADVLRFETFMERGADYLFMYKYPPGSPFDELRVRVG